MFSVSTDLVSVTEIARMLGVSRQRVNQLIQAYEDFPEPEADLAIGRVWSRSAVQAWEDSHPRRSGRRVAESKTVPTQSGTGGSLVEAEASEADHKRPRPRTGGQRPA
jgi:predicted DNA-binding transcriptional regulator AlpA